MGTENPHIQKAYDAIFQRDFAKAIRYFREAIEKEPREAAHYYKLSVTYARNNQLEDAIRAAQQALSLKPECRLYIYHLDMLYSRKYCYDALACMERQNKWKSCLFFVRKAMQLDPLNEQAYLLHGMIQHRLGDRQRAMESLYKVLELAPDHKEAKQLLQEIE